MSIRTSSRSTFTSRKVPSSRSMAPCRSHHGNHTRKELGHCSDPLRNESHNMQLDRNRGPKVDKPLQVRQRDVPLWITVTSGRLLWHRNQSHTCAPCNMKKEKRKTQKFIYIYLDVTHTHARTHFARPRRVSTGQGQWASEGSTVMRVAMLKSVQICLVNRVSKTAMRNRVKDQHSPLHDL